MAPRHILLLLLLALPVLIPIGYAAQKDEEREEGKPNVVAKVLRDVLAPTRGCLPKADVARATVTKYAGEAFPLWAMDHADRACPATLTELARQVAIRDERDPWGHPYRMYCGATLPPGALGIGIASDGPDGMDWTADDVKSWEP